MRGCNKCECNFFSDSQLLNSQLTYYVHIRGDESRRAQNAIIEFAISLKTRKRNLFTTHLNVGLRYLAKVHQLIQSGIYTHTRKAGPAVHTQGRLGRQCTHKEAQAGSAHTRKPGPAVHTQGRPGRQCTHKVARAGSAHTRKPGPAVHTVVHRSTSTTTQLLHVHVLAVRCSHQIYDYKHSYMLQYIYIYTRPGPHRQMCTQIHQYNYTGVTYTCGQVFTSTL